MAFRVATARAFAASAKRGTPEYFAELTRAARATVTKADRAAYEALSPAEKRVLTRQSLKGFASIDPDPKVNPDVNALIRHWGYLKANKK